MSKHRQNNKNRQDKGRLLRIVTFLLMIFGLAALLYPTVSNLWNECRNERIKTEYSHTVHEFDSSYYDKIFEEAREYNRLHKCNNIEDVFDSEVLDYIETHPYDDLLNPNGDGVMGYLLIDKLNLSLPIYHGTAAVALEQGCGHMLGTSLPVGGETSHAVLAAHRGLPQAKLFTDLDQMEIGDVFIIDIMDEKMAYEVDQILTVRPEEGDALQIEPGEDYVTLLTCTPYGVNTHRLLIRGHRTEYVPPEDLNASKSMLEEVLGNSAVKLFLIAVGVLFFLVLFAFFLFRKDKPQRRN